MNYDDKYLGKNFGKKLNIAINQKYKDLPERKRKAQFKKDFCANQETAREEKSFNNTFHKWIYGNIVPDTVTIIGICNFFNCEMDYFLTEQECFSKSIQSAAEETSLGYDAIDAIHQLSEYERLLLKTFLEKKYFCELSYSIYAYMSSIYEDVKVENKDTEEIEILSIEDRHDFALFRASNRFNNLLSNQLSIDPDIVKLNRVGHALKILQSDKFQKKLEESSKKAETLILSGKKTFNELCDEE